MDFSPPSVSSEFVDAQLGDRRRLSRLLKLVDAIAGSPGESLPERAKNDSELEATYRFLSNDDIAPGAITDAHIRCTVRRAIKHEVILVIHDTTELSFGGEKLRNGLGRVGSYNQGFLAHPSLAVSLAGEPLGLLELYAWKRAFDCERLSSQANRQSDPNRESLRWHDSVHAANERLAGKAQAIHVMDREGDSYELMADMLEHEIRFVVRVAHDRRLDPNKRAQNVPKLFETLSRAPLMLEREVQLSTRGKKGRSTTTRAKFPVRESRNARLEVRAQSSIAISIAQGGPLHVPVGLTLNFVEVREPDAPPDTEPVFWRLVTTEPVDTPEKVASIVDAYCKRWLVEEFFKALKTGCKYESLQLESAHGLLIALAIYCAVAWRLLLIRWTERHVPNLPAEEILPPTQLQVLRAVRARNKRPLPDRANAQDVLKAIAGLGGHLKRNGPPGWLVLCRGFHKLVEYENACLAFAGMNQDAINH